MKIYNLTIVYDENTDEIEYIEESVDGVQKEVDYFEAIANDEYEMSTTLDILRQVKEKAKA